MAVSFISKVGLASAITGFSVASGLGFLNGSSPVETFTRGGIAALFVGCVGWLSAYILLGESPPPQPPENKEKPPE